MSDAQRPDVIQGRLGWESGDISEAKPEELEPHPKNVEIYGDTEDPEQLEGEFVESIRKKGVLEPIIIADGKQIISGHRRQLAAEYVGENRVPVLKYEFDSDLAKREALIELNRQREKTPGQVVNEFEEMLAIEKERAKERQSSEGNQYEGKETFPDHQTGQARDKAAEKVNADVSGRTLEKGLKVKEKAEEGDETAKEKWDGLQTGDESFSSAYEAVTDNGDEDTSDIDQFTSQDTDEWSSPRELVEPIDEAIGGFDLDPCSGAERSPFATDTYTEDDDGLAQPWMGTVWVNPPYSAVSDWVDKAVTELEAGNAETIVFLCKGDSSTEWWQTAAEAASCVLAIDRRLKFGDGENSAPFPSHIFVFGDKGGLEPALSAEGVILYPGGDE